METNRGYYEDSYCREWKAGIVRRVHGDGRVGLVLDRTCFYPGGGGQPPDQGSIAGQPLLEITEEDDVIHWVAAEPGADLVACALDWPRRWDYMQQHTGQHILSAAFESELDADTVSFHLGEDTVSIDLNRTGLTEEDLKRVERAANQVVMGDLPLHIHYFEPGQPIPFPLRKPPAVQDTVRIVAVEGVDYSPCGGTHCARAGEVGTIKIVRAERRGGETRIYFLCGWRALADYQRKDAIVSALAGHFTVADAELQDAVVRLEDEARSLRKELSHVQGRLFELEAAHLLADAERIGEVRVVTRVFDDRDGETVKRLALQLAAQGQCVALLAARGNKIQVAFARSEDVRYDMAALLREVAPLFGGRGGGQPQLAQGGGADPARLEDALRQAVNLLKER
jgi:alanyl-tRNA synthetase